MDTPFPILSDEELHQQPTAVGGMDAASAGSAPDFVEAHVSFAPAQNAAHAGLHEALSLALETASQVMDNLVGRAMLGLDRQATAHPDASQRALLDAAAAAMDGQRGRWSKQLMALLRVAFAHPLADTAAMPPVDLRVCAQEMAHLDAVMLAAGSQRGNPLRPASYVRALLELISRTDARPEIRQVWSHFLLGALGTQLAWAYLQMAASVLTPGVRDTAPNDSAQEFVDYANYVYGLGGVAPPDELSQAMPKPEMTSEMRALAQDARQMVAQLRSVLGRSVPAALEDGEDEMSRMMRDIEESEQLMMEVDERGLELPMPETEEQAGAKRARLVDRLIEDYRGASTPSLARVPMPLRNALDQLQQPLERLAARDDAMLTQPDHAVCLFLHSITQRSFLYASESADGFTNFFNPVQKMLMAISQVAQPSAKVYEQALARLQPIWAQQDIELKTLEANKERSVEQLAQRKQLASRLAFELVGRRDAGDAPVAVKQFLMGPWALVLARAKIQPERPQDDQLYDDITALLLWSVSTRRAGAHKAQLTHLAPQLIESLRAGLATVQHSQDSTDALMNDLKKLHDDVLTAGTDDGAQDTQPPAPFR